jgi:hypothetical protein
MAIDEREPKARAMNRERRFMRLQDLGCLPCDTEGFPGVPVDAHHLVDKGTRELSGGDAATLPLCPWHHRGVPNEGMTVDEMLYRIGPSLRHHKKLFVKIYGTERELLAETDKRIEALERAA